MTDEVTGQPEQSAEAGGPPQQPAEGAGAQEQPERLKLAGGAAVEETLPGRIEALKEMAMNLLKEVQAISALQTADIRRGVSFYDEVQRFEVQLILRALEITGGHQVRAARLLGMNVTTLNSKVKRYGIPIPGDMRHAA